MNLPILRIYVSDSQLLGNHLLIDVHSSSLKPHKSTACNNGVTARYETLYSAVAEHISLLGHDAVSTSVNIPEGLNFQSINSLRNLNTVRFQKPSNTHYGIILEYEDKHECKLPISIQRCL
jgi:hypothetical protein